MSERRAMSAGRWVFRFTVAWMAMWLFTFGLVGFGLELPIRRLVIPWLVMSVSGVVMAFVTYWARSPVDQPPTVAAPRRFAFLMLVLVTIVCGTMLWSAVMLGIVSRATAMSEYLPFFALPSVVLPVSMYYYARRKVRAA